MDHTPETIEAMEPTAYIEIAELADSLHEGTTGVLQDMLNPQDVEEQITLRRMLRLKIDEAANTLAAKVADLDALKKELRVKKGYASSDLERLESWKINLYIKAKELRTRP